MIALMDPHSPDQHERSSVPKPPALQRPPVSSRGKPAMMQHCSPPPRRHSTPRHHGLCSWTPLHQTRGGVLCLGGAGAEHSGIPGDQKWHNPFHSSCGQCSGRYQCSVPFGPCGHISNPRGPFQSDPSCPSDATEPRPGPESSLTVPLPAP